MLRESFLIGSGFISTGEAVVGVDAVSSDAEVE